MKPFFFAGLLLLAAGAVAQEIPSRPNEGVQRTETRREQYGNYQKLNLTAEQKIRLEALQKENREALAAIRNNPGLTKTEKKEKLKVFYKQQAGKRDALLTREQQQIWKEEGLDRTYRKEHTVFAVQRKTTGREGNPNTLPQTAGKTGKRDTRSPEQQQKMEALALDFKKQARSIRQDNALSAAEKETRINALKKNIRKKRRAVLTTE
ncbi:hypothetical protein [Niabella beijingensis]|uniref:hypothetical protein n=1 Tax=Niabella beijingensis TaxID=2872700 RepID=UPI001CBB9529|nr:hypothetical protein [Niabella beijingensis]MBZ4189555.1 hypothetical protein [Niabella beijingensis]